MVALVHAALLSLLIVWTPPPGRGRDPVFVTHIREHGRTYVEQSAYVRQLAAWMQLEAEQQHVPVWLIAALAGRESGGNVAALSRIDGISLGMMQLNPFSHWGQGWRTECRLTPTDCAQANLHWGVRALRDGYNECGSWRAAIVFYRSGHCRAKQVVADGADRVLLLASTMYLEHGAQP